MFQIREQIIADVMFSTGERYEYRVTPEQLATAEAMMVDGCGILRWQPDFGSRTDPLEVIAVAHIARLRHYITNDTTDALVQLWHRRDTGQLYVGDPDDGRHLHRLEGLTDENGRPWFDGRTFAVESGLLILGEMGIDDLGATTVGRPDPGDADMVLVAVGRRGGTRLEVSPDDLGQLDAGALYYLGELIPEPLRPTPVIPQRQRPALNDWPAQAVRA